MLRAPEHGTEGVGQQAISVAMLRYLWSILPKTDMGPHGSPQCLPIFEWANNEIGQNPCIVANLLIESCSEKTQPYILHALRFNERLYYEPPTEAEASSCSCSMSVYNLVQACSACQIPMPIYAQSWKEFTSHCLQPSTNAYPFVVPPSTVIPEWAKMNNSLGAINLGMAYYQTTHAAVLSPTETPPPPLMHMNGTLSGSLSSTSTYSAPLTSTSTMPARESSSIPAMCSGKTTSDDSSRSPSTMIAAYVSIGILSALLAIVLGCWARRYQHVRREASRSKAFAMNGGYNAETTTSMHCNTRNFRSSVFPNGLHTLKRKVYISSGKQLPSSTIMSSIETNSALSQEFEPRFSRSSRTTFSSWSVTDGTVSEIADSTPLSSCTSIDSDWPRTQLSLPGPAYLRDGVYLPHTILLPNESSEGSITASSTADLIDFGDSISGFSTISQSSSTGATYGTSELDGRSSSCRL